MGDTQKGRCHTCFLKVREIQKRRQSGKLFTYDNLLSKLETMSKTERLLALSTKEITYLRQSNEQLLKQYEENARKLSEYQSNELVMFCMEAVERNLLPEDSIVKSLFISHIQMEKLKQCRKAREIRWPVPIIKWCLQLLHTGNSRAYRCMSNFIHLPSIRRLRDYNHINQTRSGWIEEDIKVMVDTCRQKHKSPYGMLVFDEVSVHEGLVWTRANVLLGFADNLDRGLSGATNVLQFVYRTLEEDAMTFPFAFFCTKNLDHSFIDTQFYAGVKMIVEVSKCLKYPMHVIATCFDGLAANRKMWRDHFRIGPDGSKIKNAELDLEQVHIYRGSKIADIDSECPFLIFLVDPPHVQKRNRNCLHESFWGDTDKRKMCYRNMKITWAHIRDTYNYDCARLQLKHTRLTNEAVNGLDHYRKMRTYLASIIFQDKTMKVMREALKESIYHYQSYLLLTLDHFLEERVTGILVVEDQALWISFHIYYSVHSVNTDGFEDFPWFISQITRILLVEPLGCNQQVLGSNHWVQPTLSP